MLSYAMRCVALLCVVLLCVVMCCAVLRGTALQCAVLRCVAVQCSAVHWVASRCGWLLYLVLCARIAHANRMIQHGRQHGLERHLNVVCHGVPVHVIPQFVIWCHVVLRHGTSWYMTSGNVMSRMSYRMLHHSLQCHGVAYIA